MRTAIYARYSTELQSDRSIEDQYALCEGYAAREGLTVVARFEDRARSGGSTLGRDGLAAMMAMAAKGEVDVLLVEALDRISRDMEDLSGIYKRLNFAGVGIRAVHEGEINTVLVGLRGLVGQLYREDLAHKVRRGLAGRAAEGLVATGICYGYRTVPGQPGHRTIDEGQAEVVRRIFAEYLGGLSACKIAAGLNADGIPSPGGGPWSKNAIKGGDKLDRGILRRPIYAGVVTWGRMRNVRNPHTGRQVKRPGEVKGVAVEKPELAIVSREDWDRAQREIEARRTARPGSRGSGRGTYALSGLLRCGACGDTMVSAGRCPRGRRRVACSSYGTGKLCPARRTYYLERVQGAVIDALRSEMQHPSVIAEFVRTYHDERRRLAASEGSRRAGIERRIAVLKRERERLVDCIAKGHGDPAVLGPRATEAHQEMERLSRDLAAEAVHANVIALHPTAIARYEALLHDLQTVLADGGASIAKPLRELIDSVTVTAQPGYSQPVHIRISGRLTPLLGVSSYPDGVLGRAAPHERDAHSPQSRGPLFSITVAA